MLTFNTQTTSYGPDQFYPGFVKLSEEGSQIKISFCITKVAGNSNVYGNLVVHVPKSKGPNLSLKLEISDIGNLWNIDLNVNGDVYDIDEE